MEKAELDGLTFTCLEGCGFCCTFQPEVSTRELALLRARFRPQPIAVSVDTEGRTHLGLQNKCGACTLLSRKACTAYDLRPAHCRYFPFHVHFAEKPEAYVNYTCRGVVREPTADLQAAFAASVVAVARPEEIKEHEELAREAYGQFQRRARRAGVWGDVDALTSDALAEGSALFTAAWLEKACELAGEGATREEILEDALTAFHEEDVTRRPFYLTADLKWLTFAGRADGGLDVLEMDERGELLPAGVVAPLSPWQDVPLASREGLAEYLRALTTRRIFAGSVYALIDDREYALTMRSAVLLRVAEVAADLALRARILLALGTPEERVPDETARFYDSTFLDSPAIGGFL